MENIGNATGCPRVCSEQATEEREKTRQSYNWKKAKINLTLCLSVMTIFITLSGH